MGLDIRLPIGLMFSLLGPLLVVTGIVNSTPLNEQAGAAMAIFGFSMLYFALRAVPEPEPVSQPMGEPGDPEELGQSVSP